MCAAHMTQEKLKRKVTQSSNLELQVIQHLQQRTINCKEMTGQRKAMLDFQGC